MNDTIRLLHVVGARPNFMKMAPLMRAVDRWNREGAALLAGIFDDARRSRPGQANGTGTPPGPDTPTSPSPAVRAVPDDTAARAQIRRLMAQEAELMGYAPPPDEEAADPAPAPAAPPVEAPPVDDGLWPEFVRQPLRGLIGNLRFEQVLVHTGQHYDEKMSGAFFDELEIPRPDMDLEVGSASHAVQTARLMEAFEPVLDKVQPHLVVVVGDVNSTMACAVTAVKRHIPVAHVEAGLRSRDRSMPEEINRLVTDAVARLLFVSEESGLHHLRREGVHDDRIFFTGNIMIDTLRRHLARVDDSVLARWHLEPGDYATLTLHRPSNVDDAAVLGGILSALERIAQRVPIVFPIHPRTRKQVDGFGLAHHFRPLAQRQPYEPGIFLAEPMPYLDLLALNRGARLILTDSGGLQEEATALGVPCLTLRQSTERPVTVDVGTNTVVGTDPAVILEQASLILNGEYKRGAVPVFYDGQTAERIVAGLLYWWTAAGRDEFPLL